MEVERSTSGRGVNPCERYHRNGTGGVVTCACLQTSGVEPPLRATLVPDRRWCACVRARDHDIIQPKAPKKRGRSSLSLGPSGEGPHGQMSADGDPCDCVDMHALVRSLCLALLRLSNHPLTHFLIGVRAYACVPLLT